MGPSWALVGPQRPSTGKQARAGPAKPARALLCQTSEVLLGAAGPNAAGRARPARARPGQTRPGRARPGLGVAVARPRHAPPWTACGWPSPTGKEEGALKERRRVHGMTGTHTHDRRHWTHHTQHSTDDTRHIPPDRRQRPRCVPICFPMHGASLDHRSLTPVLLTI